LNGYLLFYYKEVYISLHYFTPARKSKPHLRAAGEAIRMTSAWAERGYPPGKDASSIACLGEWLRRGNRLPNQEILISPFPLLAKANRVCEP